MAYRDIDYSIRVNGDISVPADSIFIGDGTTLTPNQIQSGRIIGALEGDGSKVTGVHFSNIINKPTTLSGYGITAQYYTKQESDAEFGTKISGLRSDLTIAQNNINSLDTNLTTAKNSLQEQLDAARAELEGIEVGGRNLILDSITPNISVTHGRILDKDVDTPFGIHDIYYWPERVDLLRYEVSPVPVNISEKYVFSFYAKTKNPGQEMNIMIDISDEVHSTKHTVITDEWQRFYVKAHKLDKGRLHVDISLRSDDVPVYIAFWQLEYGDKLTPWTPAPEDTEQKITTLNQQIELLNERMEDDSIHKDWGNWDTYSGDGLRSNGRPIIWAPGDGTRITLNNQRIFESVDVLENLRVNGNNVYHSGNLTPSNFITKSSGQSVGNGFSVGGRLLVGSVSNQNGDVVVYNNSGHPTIHLDGNSSGIESASNTKSYIDGNGNMKLSATAEARILKATVSVDAPRVNTERINDVRVDDMTKNHSIADTGGWGVQSGMDGEAYGGELHVQPGVAYTKSGRRIEITTRTKVVMRPASSSGRRYDILYIKGPSASTEEGEFGYFEGSVGGSEQSSLTNRALDDAVILASIRRDANQASITQGNINNTVRTQSGITGERPLYVDGNNQNVKVRYTVEANAFHEGGRHLNTIYSTLAGGNTFTSNQVFNGRIRIQSSGTLSGSHSSGNYSVRMGNSSHYIATDGKEFLASSDMVIGANGELTLKGNRLNVEAPVKSSRNATTVSIPAGETRATWTHNYGNTNYAVNLTTNSFERHVRWDNKANNTITIEIDDATDKEILVDCILMGY